MASMTKREMAEYEQDIALSLEYTRACLAMCDEIVAGIEHVYVNGIPLAQRDIYRDGLEARANAREIARTLDSSSLTDAWEASHEMEESMRQAAVFLATVEHSLFPEQRLRTLPRVPDAQTGEDRRGKPIVTAALAFVVFLLFGLAMGYLAAGGFHPGMYAYGGATALLAGGMAYRLAS